jgi:branched-chain amino acid transport system ATP-binding protein
MELVPYRKEKARNLPFGLQRRVEIARALASSPKLLLLDEPAAGMNPHETEELMETIQSIHSRYQLTICLVEHDMKVVMGICPRIQVLDQGRVLMEGNPQEIQNDPRVIKAYLGVPREESHAEH